MTTFIQNDGRITTAATSDAPERISASLAFAKWTKTQGAKWNLGALWDDGKFVNFMDPDTDTAWLAFSAAWRLAATPEALASSPEVAALIAEARREGWNTAIEAAERSVASIAVGSDAALNFSHSAQRTIRALKETTHD